ncbi:hypothetical protein [Brevibacillus composti]|nr:hypothetical protein [Brevibacillus composti]
MFFAWYYEKVIAVFLELLPLFIILSPYLLTEVWTRLSRRGHV